MRCAALLLVLGVCVGVFAMNATASSELYYVYADVVDVEPLIERRTVSQPRETCSETSHRSSAHAHGNHRHYDHRYQEYDDGHDHTRRADSHGSGVARIIGGVIGGLVGSQFGGGRGSKALAVTGAILGASIGRRVSRHRHEAYASPYVPQQCTTVMETREVEEISGYRVRYLYQGQEFTKRVDDDPGDRIRVQVQVTPVAAEPAS